MKHLSRGCNNVPIFRPNDPTQSKTLRYSQVFCGMHSSTGGAKVHSVFDIFFCDENCIWASNYYLQWRHHKNWPAQLTCFHHFLWIEMVL